MTRCGVSAGVVMVATALLAACVSSPRAGDTTPRVVEFPRPDIPAGVVIPPDIRARHLAAWDALQSMEIQRAAAEFIALLARHPAFYPARAGVGFTQLARRQYREADGTFAAVLRDNDRYVPAWIGRGEALLAAGRQAEALDVLERVVALEPRRESARTRLELVRLRVTQGLIDDARRASAGGRLDVAERHLERAWSMAPSSAAILRELVAVELGAGHLDEAEAHARRAVVLEPKDGQWQAVLGDVLEARQSYREAAAAYLRAAALEPRPEWNARALDLREKAEAALLPATFARLTSAPKITRAELAAFVAIHLEAVVVGASRRVADVAVDARTHWAATWIVPVTRAGIMAIYSNHTFQPDAVVDRAELARVAAILIRLAAADRSAELAQWRTARPALRDLPSGHASYTAAALAIAAGALTADADGRFHPANAATGRELASVVRRVRALHSR